MDKSEFNLIKSVYIKKEQFKKEENTLLVSLTLYMISINQFIFVI